MEMKIYLNKINKIVYRIQGRPFQRESINYSLSMNYYSYGSTRTISKDRHAIQIVQVMKEHRDLYLIDYIILHLNVL